MLDKVILFTLLGIGNAMDAIAYTLLAKIIATLVFGVIAVGLLNLWLSLAWSVSGFIFAIVLAALVTLAMSEM